MNLLNHLRTEVMTKSTKKVWSNNIYQIRAIMSKSWLRNLCRQKKIAVNDLFSQSVISKLCFDGLGTCQLIVIVVIDWFSQSVLIKVVWMGRFPVKSSQNSSYDQISDNKISISLHILNLEQNAKLHNCSELYVY